MNKPEWEAVKPQVTAVIRSATVTAQKTWLPATVNTVPNLTVSVRGFPVAAGNEETVSFGCASRTTNIGCLDADAFKNSAA
jgi:hypothetical protein